jgi:hypothetical protein
LVILFVPTNRIARQPFSQSLAATLKPNPAKPQPLR